MGLSVGYSAQVRYAASLHDIGKVVIPDSILNKPGPLNDDEWAVMRQHSRLGFNILRGAADPTVRLAANVVLYHHECWDGSGYPDGLAGEAIPREARIVGVCDVYHALRETRPYRDPLTHDHALSMMLQGEGRMHPGQFDPVVLAVFGNNADVMRDAYEASVG
jgi:putative two-component system response regulator